MTTSAASSATGQGPFTRALKPSWSVEQGEWELTEWELTEEAHRHDCAKLESEIERLAAKLNGVKGHGRKGLNRRIRLGKRLDAARARLAALILAH